MGGANKVLDNAGLCIASTLAKPVFHAEEAFAVGNVVDQNAALRIPVCGSVLSRWMDEN